MSLYRILDNPPASLAMAAGIAVGTLLLVGFVVAFAKRKLYDAAGTSGDVDDFLLDFVSRTSIAMLVAPALYLGSRVLAMPDDVERLLVVLTRLAVVAQVALWSAAVLDFLLRRYHRRRVETDPGAVTTIRAFRFAALTGVWSTAVLVALDNLGIDVTALVTGLGIGGVAIALATQNILGDLFASLSIVLDKPFVVGDFIRSGEHMGVVEQIGLKTTRVRSLSGEQLIFSNNDLLQSRLRNYQRMDERRVVFGFGLVYSTPPELLERVPSLVRAIIESAEPVRFDRGHFAAFGESSYQFEFVYFVLSPDYNLYMDVQQRINLEIVRAFAREGVEFAFPTRTVYVMHSDREGSAARVESWRPSSQIGS